jgi:hypothetical protein
MKLTPKRQSNENATIWCAESASWWLKLRLLFALAGTLGLAAEAVHGKVSDKTLGIRIRVNDYAQVSPKTLSGTEREAARIIGKTGLRTDWLNCPVKSKLEVEQDSCRESFQPMDIVLRLIPEPQNNKYDDSVFGFAVVPILASVYVNYAVERAKRDNAEFEIPMVLGNVIAHEIGHLLLGPNSHSGFGIMQKRWQRSQVRQAVTGNLLFTEEQGSLMRAEIQKRANVQRRPIDSV